MILRFFKTQSFFAFVALFTITLLLWLDVLIFKNSNYFITKDSNVLFQLCFSWLEKYKFIALTISFLFIFIQALWLNSIVVNSDITAKGTLIPSLIYITLMCSNNEMLSLNGVVLSAFFILYILQISFKIYGREDVYMDIFKISMVLSIASLFYFPILFFLVFVWMIILVYRALSFRLFVISLVGFLIPYCYVLFFYFWFDKTKVFLEHFSNILNSISLHHINFSIYWGLTPIMLAIIYLLSVIGIYRKINSRVIKIRKYIYIITWLFFISLIVALFFSDSTLVSLSLLCIPATFFVSDFFITIKRKWLAELILFIIIVFIFIEKFYLKIK